MNHLVRETTPVVIYDEYGTVRKIRTKQWKYEHRYPYGLHELFHLTTGPMERLNLYGEEQHTSTVEQLKHQLEGWFLQYTKPELDGVRQQVYGYGQLQHAGFLGKGRKAYHSGDE